ncbi:hypothetical protein EZV62_011811 [Acer yangbiense]|uniref:Uncharacterized protein n=1 Tax=Acer yangbiense TaxID=1000413 RepID=A0A5C7I6J8_9ROSI|nr:hypothetical protein EZV62_011811 [Acer yangbiense]
MTEKYGQQGLLDAQEIDGINAEVKEALLNLENLSRDGLEKLMKEQKLNVVVTPGADFSPVLAIGHITKAYRDCTRVRVGYQDQEASSSIQALKKDFTVNT